MQVLSQQNGTLVNASVAVVCLLLPAVGPSLAALSWRVLLGPAGF